jgi:hypothetical protein
VLRDYVNYGLVEDTSGRVRLKCGKYTGKHVRHVWRMLKLGTGSGSICEFRRSVEAWSVLPQIDERNAMEWIVPSSETSVLLSYERLQKAVWRRPENVTNCQVSKATHLVSLI